MDYVNNMPINQNARFYTVLKREKAQTAFIFVWDFSHWLTFDSAGKCNDIRYYGTGKSYAEALEIINREIPDYKKVVTRYCPKSFIWQ